VRSLDPASKTTQPIALDAIATALSNPNIFSFDPLFKLDAILAVQTHPLFKLLQIFLNGGLDELHAWQQAHASTITEFRTSLPIHIPSDGANHGAYIGLDVAQLERKIRLLALADLGFQNIGQDLPYAQVSATLQVPTSQIERWVIDGKHPSLLTTIYPF